MVVVVVVVLVAQMITLDFAEEIVKHHMELHQSAPRIAQVNAHVVVFKFELKHV